MTLIKFKHMTLRLSCLLAVMSAASGCILDVPVDCEDVYTLTVRAYDVSGDELSAGEVKDVTLFVFDGGGRFVRKTEARIGQRIQIKAPSGEELQIVAWGNLTDGAQTCTEPAPGDPLDGCFVELSSLARAASPVYSPGDLFRGHITITRQDRSGEEELPMYREVGSIAVTIRGLKTFAGFDDGDYSVAVRETPSAIGFDGALSGDRAFYRPQGSFAGNGDFTVAPFNLLPETALHIDIYHGTQLVATVSKDNAANPLAVEKGRLTNVLIDLKASLSVSISIGNWGDTQVWKEF